MAHVGSCLGEAGSMNSKADSVAVLFSFFPGMIVC